MKPRLKLRTNGTLQVVAPGPLGWSVFEASAFIKRHYGTRQAFAQRFGLHYGMLCDALRDDRLRVSRAGAVAEIRQLLGLASSPTAQSARLSASYYRARGLSPTRGLGAEE